ncbi:LapA family protein [Nocardia sp. SSK8]|uniref:LapA family protein n=1 Tax=Nocardia sp. SSK8 TaxID=3120154 RepID=UPI0030090A3A
MSTNAESGATPAAEEPVPEHLDGKHHKRVPAETTPTRRPTPDALVKSRTGYTWIALLAAAILGVLLLIFIIQNLDQAPVQLFFWDFSLPLGITVLLSVIVGALVMGLVGGVRILQLRRAAKKP